MKNPATPGLRRMKKKVGKLPVSHRYNHLPLLYSYPGGFNGSWSYRTYPLAKVGKEYQ